METRLRLPLTRAGLPRPKSQHEVVADRRVLARLDLAWPELCVAVEYDGAQHWQQRQEDDQRRAAARRLGWWITVVGAKRFFGDPDAIVEEVRWALDDARSRRSGRQPHDAACVRGMRP